MLTKHSVCVAMLACLAVILLPQTGTAEALSLKQAIEYAARNNPTAAAARLSADAARYAAAGARALTNPEIFVAPSVIGDAGSDSAVFFSQPLEINGSRRIRSQIAAAQARAAGSDATAAQRDILLRTKQAYWDLARSQEVVKFSQSNIEYLDSIGKAVEKQLQAGAVPGSQVVKTQVEISRARQESAQARLQMSQAQSALNALLNRASVPDVTASDPLEFRDVVISDKQSQLPGAYQSRPELASAQARVEAARREVRQAEVRRVPDIALQARREMFDPGSDGGVAIAVTLPIIDWGSVRAERRQAETTARAREKDLEAARNAVGLDVQLAVQALETSSQIVREYQGGILDKSEQLAAMAQKGFEKGATSYLEVLEAQRTLRNTRTAYYSALADRAKAIAQLEWATGADLLNTSEVKK